MDSMVTKELGSTGVLLPEIGLGTGLYHGGPSPLRKGLEAGALFIDTAESYGTETVVGALSVFATGGDPPRVASGGLAPGLEDRAGDTGLGLK